jgi:hypothetical protein
MKTLLLVIMAALTCFKVNSASWYVDNEAAGANNGTSWTDAWEDMNVVVWGGAGVAPGDTLYISGGETSKTYTNTWTVTAHGTAANRITIRVGQDEGHNGHVYFDGEGRGNQSELSFFSSISRNYITLDGSVDGEARLSYINLVNSNSVAPLGRNFCFGIYSSTGIENVYKYINFSNVNSGMKLGYGSVHNCTFRVRGDAAITQLADGTGWDQILIYSNSVTILVKPGGGGPDGFQVRPGTSVYNNAFRVEQVDYYTSGQHPDYIQGLNPRWFKFYNNVCINYGDSGVTLAPFTGSDGMQDIRIYNNIFRQTELFDNVPEYIRFITSNKQPNGFYKNIYIVNNLFADNDNANTSAVSFYSEVVDAGIQGTNNWLANNIWVGCSINAFNPMFNIRTLTANNPSVWTVTNNVYHSVLGDSSGRLVYYGTNMTVAAFIAAVDLTGAGVSPTFVSYVPDSEDNDFRLAEGDTIAIDQGISFSELFTTDADGNERFGTWDIGPYEGAGAPTSPTINTHPSSQTIASGATASMTVSATGTATLTYQWYIGTSGTTTSPISGATSSSYTTDSLTSTTQYWVRVTNDQGSDDSNTATITVESSEPPPPATGTISVNTANVGAISKP